MSNTAEPTNDPIEQLRQSYEHTISTMAQQQEDLKHAMDALNTKLEAAYAANANNSITIDVLQEQRQTLLAQLTTSQRNHKIEVRDLSNQFKSEITSRDSAHKIQLASHHQNLVAQKSDLSETLHKFGVVKHDLHQQRTKTDELTNLLNWFLELTGEFNGSIQRELGESLTIESLRLAKERMPLAKGLSKKKVLALFK